MFLTSLGTLFLSVLIAQDVASIGMQNEFSDMAKRANQWNGMESYSAGIVNGSQFYFRKWSKGTVTNLQKRVIQNSSYAYLYDKVRQELFVKEKDTTSILLADKSQIFSFELISSDKKYSFESGAHFDPAKKDIFFEVLVKSDSGYTLLKQTKTTFVKADYHDMEKVKSGENYDEFKDEIFYYISLKNGIPQPIELKEKSIKKAFTGSPKFKLVQDFIQQNNGSINEQFLIDLIHDIN